MLYQVRGRSLRIMASMHWFPTGHNDLPPWVEMAYHWAVQIVSEHDTANFDPLRRLPHGQSLQRIAPTTVWETLSREWPHLADLDSLKPWAASMEFGARRLGSLERGVERQLIPRARHRSRPVMMLETKADFVNLIDEAPHDVWWLPVIVNSPIEEVQQHFRALYDAWSTCNGERIAALPFPGGMVLHHEQRRVMLEARNQRWAKWIATCFLSVPTLIIVGCLHLVGERNLIAALADNGVATDRLL